MKPNRALKPVEKAPYQKLCNFLKRPAARNGQKGFTVSDICAATALPLSLVKELIPRAADEFSAQLKVTESGEIIYSFPHGFISRYHGFGVRLAVFFTGFIRALRLISSFIFKVWIMVMLIGYFVVFIAIALGSVFISMSGNSKNSSRRGGSIFGQGLFSMIWRLWFYSELTHSMTRRNSRWLPGQEARQAAAPPRPMHKAVFSFVFGDDNPDKEPDTGWKKAALAYIQSHKGLISMPEFMAISGKNTVDAESGLLAFCVEYGGSPEATDDGTIVYRFDELLLRANTQDRSFSELSPPINGLKSFSKNSKTMNVWFGIINAVNLIFGSYYLGNALQTGAIIFTDESKLNSLYKFTYWLFTIFSANPLPLIGIALGLVPLIFSLLFWLIPALRFYFLRSDNENTRLKNLRRLGYRHIWNSPTSVKETDIQSRIDECRPKKIKSAQRQIIKEMGAYSIPDLAIDENGVTLYAFNELEREKQALEKCRSSVSYESSSLGGIVFDTGAGGK